MSDQSSIKTNIRTEYSVLFNTIYTVYVMYVYNELAIKFTFLYER